DVRSFRAPTQIIADPIAVLTRTSPRRPHPDSGAGRPPEIVRDRRPPQTMMAQPTTPMRLDRAIETKVPMMNRSPATAEDLISAKRPSPLTATTTAMSSGRPRTMAPAMRARSTMPIHMPPRSTSTSSLPVRSGLLPGPECVSDRRSGTSGQPMSAAAMAAATAMRTSVHIPRSFRQPEVMGGKTLRAGDDLGRPRGQDSGHGLLGHAEGLGDLGLRRLGGIEAEADVAARLNPQLAEAADEQAQGSLGEVEMLGRRGRGSGHGRGRGRGRSRGSGPWRARPFRPGADDEVGGCGFRGLDGLPGRVEGLASGLDGRLRQRSVDLADSDADVPVGVDRDPSHRLGDGDRIGQHSLDLV